MTRKTIQTPDAPKAIGPYSQAIQAGDTVYLSGQIGLDPASGQMVEGTEAQAHRVLQNLRAVARAPEDGVIEALEGTAPDHFVLAVQWHPERSTHDDAASRELFRALVEAARVWRAKKSTEYRVPST